MEVKHGRQVTYGEKGSLREKNGSSKCQGSPKCYGKHAQEIDRKKNKRSYVFLNRLEKQADFKS